ncbi:hypothetical protein M2366_001065 [Aeromonas sp. BIGb0405]|uniref:retropepsin-like aspartic peptidase RloA3 n=1 Tax=Aeromonas TaxID=642 RepID=UPI001CC93022|nr:MULTISPECIES: ATP-dependent zinc protease [Aeromonas]MCS3454998.1 hypothetical protein [Aeromonas sp. BIGb0405]UBO73255.1 ATP-dependent zinc protease [Aeromonas rivuli]
MKHQNIALWGLLALSLSTSQAQADSDHVYGWVEKGVIMPSGVTVKLKLDTGALTSSMDARNLTSFERDGKEWVRFNLNMKDVETDKQVKQEIERPVLRRVTVSGAGGSEQRPVVHMSICIGETLYKEEFTLRSRANMVYPVLLGRRLLAELGPVDAGRTFTTQPECP